MTIFQMMLRCCFRRSTSRASPATSAELPAYRGDNQALVELKTNLERITSLSEEQQKTIKCLEDKLLAAQEIAVETQLRQLNELQSLTLLN